MDFQVMWSKNKAKLLIIFLIKCCLLYLLTLCLMVSKLATMVGFTEKIIPIAFLGHKVKVKYWSSYQHFPLNILWTICLIITKLCTVVTTRKCIKRFANPFEFCTRGHLFFLNISCYNIHLNEFCTVFIECK